jgi:DNA-binding MarR family transcriptional regulator
MERALTVLAQKENRAELFRRLAARAQLELDPGVCWLLLRIAHNPNGEMTQLARGSRIDRERLQGLVLRAADKGLITLTEDGAGPAEGPCPALTASGRSAAQQLTEARRQGLAELLDGWSPAEHAELTALVRRLTAELLGDEQAPPGTTQAAA